MILSYREAVCDYFGACNGDPDGCELSTDTNRKGCWFEKATKKCYRYPGAPTCDTTVTGKDWVGYYQLGSCSKISSRKPTTAPSNAPSVKSKAGKEKGKQSKEKGKESMAKTTKAPVVAPGTPLILSFKLL